VQGIQHSSTVPRMEAVLRMHPTVRKPEQPLHRAHPSTAMGELGGVDQVHLPNVPSEQARGATPSAGSQ
jgi:hypothetical protein